MSSIRQYLLVTSLSGYTSGEHIDTELVDTLCQDGVVVKATCSVATLAKLTGVSGTIHIHTI